MAAGGRRELLAAAGSGLVLGAAFLPLPLGCLAWGAFVPLLRALDRRVESGRGSTFAVGYAGGLAFFLTGTHWLALLSDVATTVHWIKYVAWVLAGLYLALFWGAAAALAGGLARRSGIPPRWTFAPAMLLVEELRGSGELGFPWFQPGYTQHAYLPVLRLAALGSVTLVTLWLLLVNGALAQAWARRGRGAAFAAAALLALPWLVPAAPPARSAPGRLAALVQGDIPGAIKWSGGHQREILDRFVAMSDSAARQAGGPLGLIVWPETATGSYLRRQFDQSLAVAELAARTHAPVCTGYADYTYAPDGHALPWNAAGVWYPDGRLSPRYAKRHLVPFGERMPFEWLAPQLGRVDFGQAEWRAGPGGVVFDGPLGPFSCLICFESIFPDLARADVRAGSRLLVNVTNDEWFGNGAALVQHADMAVFRAAENAVPLLRCANTGITEVVDARGAVVARLPVFVPRTLVGAVPPAGARTPYTRFGDWPGALATAACAALALRRRRVRRA